MPLDYRVIRIYTSEEARSGGKPVSEAVVQFVVSRRIAARCVVTRGVAGSYESGEVATGNILELSYNMPLVMEIILPAAEVRPLLPGLREIVADGIVAVEVVEVVWHRVSKRLIPRQLKVKDVMTAAAKAVGPKTAVREVIALLLSSDFNAVPVVDERSHPVGMITQGDLIERAGMPVRIGLLGQFGRQPLDAYLGSLGQLPAEQVMTKPAVTIGSDKLLVEAVNLMLQRNLKRLPVVGADGVLVGIVARVDVFRAISRVAPDWSGLRAQHVDVANLRQVRDVMRRDAHTVAPDAPVEEVIRVIDTNDIQRVAVVDAEGRLLGLISDRDLLAAFGDAREGLWQHLVSRFSPAGAKRGPGSGPLAGKTASQVMRTDLVTVREETAIDEAIRLMAEKGLKRLPVVDGEGRFRGMISRDSLLRAGLEGG
jgi:CBS domain-containing protein